MSSTSHEVLSVWGTFDCTTEAWGPSVTATLLLCFAPHKVSFIPLTNVAVLLTDLWLCDDTVNLIDCDFLLLQKASSRGLDVWGFNGSAVPSWTETSDVVPRDCWSHDSSSCYQWDALILPSSCSLSHWEFLVTSYPFFLMLLSAAISKSITVAVVCSFSITAISYWLASSCLCIPQDSHPPQRCLPSQQIGSNPYRLP